MNGGTQKPLHDQPPAALTGPKREHGPNGWPVVLGCMCYIDLHKSTGLNYFSANASMQLDWEIVTTCSVG